MEERSLGYSGDEPQGRTFDADGNVVNFYKLDKTKRYCVEGGNRSAVNAVFLRRAREMRSIQKTVLNDCTLTDGKITEFYSRRITAGDGKSSSSYYGVSLRYTFTDKEGRARGGKLETVFNTEPPFFVGQNLMIAFNGEDSVILRKFALSEGAEEFKRAEAERRAVDFDCLSGKLLDFDPSKRVKTLAYSRVFVIAGCSLAGLWLLAMLPVTIIAIVEDWGMPFAVLPAAVTSVFFLLPAIYMAVSGLRRVFKLRKILKAPSFTKGIVYYDKSTYRGCASSVYYRYKDFGGGCHVEKFRGVTASRIVDGQTVTVAYRGNDSEVVTGAGFRNGRR